MPNRLILCIICIVSLLLIIASNAYITSVLNREAELAQQYAPVTKKTTAETQPTASVNKKQKRKLVPEDPAKYGVIVTDSISQPRNQMQWDRFVEKAITNAGVLDQKNAERALKTAKTTPEKFDTKMTQISERITLLEQEKNSNPSNQDAEHRLQQLYLLRSVMKAMKDRVTAP